MKLLRHDGDPATIDPPPALANGVIGLRVDLAGFSGWATASGYVGIADAAATERLAYAPWPVAVDLGWDGWWLTQRPDALTPMGCRYDLACGELISTWTLAAGAATIVVERVLLCSRTHPTIVAQELSFSADRDVRLRARIGVSPGEGVAIHRDDGRYDGQRVVDGTLLVASPGDAARAGAAFAIASASGARPVRDGLPVGIAPLVDLDLRAGARVTVSQLTSLVTTAQHARPDRQAARLAFLAAETGFASLRASNRAAWTQLWRARPVLAGAPSAWQDAADAAFHWLHASAHAATPAGTSLFGLMHWPGYPCFGGRHFWDIDLFAAPPLLLTDPDAARAILAPRLRHADAARRNAALHARRGLQYPWEASPVTGEEALPASWPQMVHEEHVSLAIAWTLARSVHAFGEPGWARQAWPVIAGVADWIASRVEVARDGAHWRRTMGICEGEITDDNASTSAAAIVVLDAAVALAHRLGETAPAAWSVTARALVVPRRGDLVLRCAGYDPATPGDATETLAAFWPYAWRTDAATTRTSLAHYLEAGRRAQGMPMLPPLFAVHAARLGDRALTTRWFAHAVEDYPIPPFLMPDEYGRSRTTTKPRVGPYLAHAGAIVQDLLLGLTGLELDGDPAQWPQHEVVLPDGVSAIEVERLWIRGRPWRLRAVHGRRTELAPLDARTASSGQPQETSRA